MQMPMPRRINARDFILETPVFPKSNCDNAHYQKNPGEIERRIQEGTERQNTPEESQAGSKVGKVQMRSYAPEKISDSRGTGIFPGSREVDNFNAVHPVDIQQKTTREGRRRIQVIGRRQNNRGNDRL